MRPHRRKAAVPVDTARAPRRAEVRRSGSGLAAARKESPPSPVVGWDGGERRKRCWGWCGRVATRTAARVVPSLVSGTRGVGGIGSREDAFGSPQSERIRREMGQAGDAS